MNVGLNFLTCLALGLSTQVAAMAIFPDDTNCGEGFQGNQLSDLCYRVYPDEQLDYIKASEFCKDLGGELVRLENLEDFQTRMRSSNTLYAQQLRIQGIQVGNRQYVDCKNESINLSNKVHKYSPHSGSLTVKLRQNKNFAVYGNKHFMDPLGWVCQRERSDKFAEEEPTRLGDKDVETTTEKEVTTEKSSGREELVLECGTRNAVTKEGSLLISHKAYPEEAYPKNLNCSSTFAVEEGQTILLSFKDFDLESSNNCKYDSFQAFDGPDADSRPLFKELQCGDKLPEDVETSGQFVSLLFKTDSSMQKTGFAALLTPSGFDEGKSCRGRCDTYDADLSCQCDGNCVTFGDCCEDLKQECDRA